MIDPGLRLRAILRYLGFNIKTHTTKRANGDLGVSVEISKESQ